jgi:hypothetical protein
MSHYESKKIYDEVHEALEMAEQMSDTVEYIALMSLLKIELEERIANCINVLYKQNMQ